MVKYVSKTPGGEEASGKLLDINSKLHELMASMSEGKKPVPAEVGVTPPAAAPPPPPAPPVGTAIKSSGPACLHSEIKELFIAFMDTLPVCQ